MGQSSRRQSLDSSPGRLGREMRGWVAVAPTAVRPPAMEPESLTWKHLNDTAVKGRRILPNSLVTEHRG